MGTYVHFVASIMNHNALPTTLAPTTSPATSFSPIPTVSSNFSAPFPDLTSLNGIMPPASFPNFSQQTSLSGLSMPQSTLNPSGFNLSGIGLNPGLNSLPNPNFAVGLPSLIGNPGSNMLDINSHLIPPDLQAKFEFAPPNKDITDIHGQLQGQTQSQQNQGVPNQSLQ